MKNRNSHQRFQSKHIIFVGALIIVAGVLFGPIYAVRSGSLSSVVQPAIAPARNANTKLQSASNLKSIQPRSSTLRSFLPTPMFDDYAETIETFAHDGVNCTATPKTDFDLGETVCAKISGAPLTNGPDGTRSAVRIGWVSPYGSFAQGATITTDPQTGTYQIPTDQTQTFTDAGGGTTVVDNRGTWTVNTFSNLDGSLRNTAYFTVHDPATPYVDLVVNQGISQQESEVNAGSSSAFHLFVSNLGPDAAQTVVLTDVVPANTTFLAFVQTSGPTFSCSPLPAVGGTGTITCNIASLAKGASAAFDFAYAVNPGAPVGTVITNTAEMSSVPATSELRPEDNSSSVSAKVVAASTGGGQGTCSVGCPDDIATDANTTQSGQDGRVVHFSPPSGNTECGVIVVDHCNDCFFPVGITTVTATSATSETCSFTVTVHPLNTGNASIVCPANQTADAHNADCDVAVTVGTPVASGNNVTFHGVRSDGKPMYNCDCFPSSPDQLNDACNVNGACSRKADALFPPGITTITWIAYTHDIAGPYATPEDEEAHRNGSASCTQTITVNDVTPPVITATNSSASANANCQAPVPDYSSTASDNCACSNSDNSADCEGHPHFTYTQTPDAGTMVGIGPHTVHIVVNDNSSNNNGAGNTSTKDVVFTVNDTTAPTVTGPADSSASADATCQAPVPDYAASSTATDNCDSSLTITQSPAAGTMVGLGPHTVTVSTTDDAGNTGSDTVVFTVNDTTAPVIVCPANKVQGTDAGSCSAVVNPGQPTTTDNCDSSVTITSTRSDGQPMNSPYPRGTTTITWRATDDSGNYSECTQTVTVFDDDAPTFTFTGTQSMWPPNHKYQTFTTANLVASVQDNCDGSIPVSSVVITKVTSDEIENGNGDGNTMNDIVIAANCKSVQLRSEREGSGNGRVYTIFFSVTDAAGNMGTGTTKVVVPHNPGGTVVDSGPHYTVTSNCP